MGRPEPCFQSQCYKEVCERSEVKGKDRALMKGKNTVCKVKAAVPCHFSKANSLMKWCFYIVATTATHHRTEITGYTLLSIFVTINWMKTNQKNIGFILMASLVLCIDLHRLFTKEACLILHSNTCTHECFKWAWHK